MAHLLLIDDDPDLLPEQVAHVFPAPKHRVEIARTGDTNRNRVLDLHLHMIDNLEQGVKEHDARMRGAVST